MCGRRRNWRSHGKGHADYCHKTGSENYESVFEPALFTGPVHCATFV